MLWSSYSRLNHEDSIKTYQLELPIARFEREETTIINYPTYQNDFSLKEVDL